MTPSSPGFPPTSLYVLSSLLCRLLKLLTTLYMLGFFRALSYNSIPSPHLSPKLQTCTFNSPPDNSSRTACGHFKLNMFRSEFVIFLPNQPYLVCFKFPGITPPNCLTPEVWGHPRALPPPPTASPAWPSLVILTQTPRYSRQFRIYPLYPGLLQQPCNWSFCLQSCFLQPCFHTAIRVIFLKHESDHITQLHKIQS